MNEKTNESDERALVEELAKRGDGVLTMPETAPQINVPLGDDDKDES